MLFKKRMLFKKEMLYNMGHQMTYNDDVTLTTAAYVTWRDDFDWDGKECYIRRKYYTWENVILGKNVTWKWWCYTSDYI